MLSRPLFRFFIMQNRVSQLQVLSATLCKGFLCSVFTLTYPFCFFGYTDERCPRDCNRPLLAKLLFSRFAVKRILRQTIPHITYCLIMLFCCFLCGRDLPGYNRTGWLGVKHQVTYFGGWGYAMNIGVKRTMQSSTASQYPASHLCHSEVTWNWGERVSVLWVHEGFGSCPRQWRKQPQQGQDEPGWPRRSRCRGVHVLQR